MKKQFAKYLQSICSPEEFEAVMQWISTQGNETSLSAVIRPQWDRYMEDEAGQTINRMVWEKIVMAIEEKEKADSQRRLKMYTWGMKVAAVLLVALLFSNLFFIRKTFFPGGNGSLQTISVPMGARSNITLPDGSTAWLNSGSTLSFSTVFGKERLLTLEGEAYFEVVKNKAPFILSTSYGNVQVTGTAFNVKALTAEGQFETTVEEGFVLITSPQTKKSASLKAGDHARLEGDQWKLRKVETDLYTSWKDGKIIFRKEFLPDVAGRLERWYNVQIQLDDDPRLERIHYTGTLEMESFSEVLELLKITASINYTYNDKTRVIFITHR
jgi:transmembrane sensor